MGLDISQLLSTLVEAGEKLNLRGARKFPKQLSTGRLQSKRKKLRLGASSINHAGRHSRSITIHRKQSAVEKFDGALSSGQHSSAKSRRAVPRSGRRCLRRHRRRMNRDRITQGLLLRIIERSLEHHTARALDRLQHLVFRHFLDFDE